MICKNCGLTQTYIRLSKNERVCRSCGYIEKLPTKQEKVHPDVSNKQKTASQKGDETK